MNNKIKIVIVLSFLAILLIIVGYIGLNKFKEINIEEKESINLEEMGNNYMSDVKIVINDFFEIVSGNNFSIEEVENIENRLLALKVPSELKDLHFNLVSAVWDAENFLQEGDDSYKLASLEKIEKARNNYPWLN